MSESSSRTYSNATIVGLMTLARGYCYWPECQTPTMRMVNGSPVLNVDIGVAASNAAHAMASASAVRFVGTGSGIRRLTS